MKHYLVIDVGGTNIKYATLNEDVQVLNKGEIPTPTTDLDDFMAAIIELVNASKTPLSGLAFSMPGIIDSTQGYMYTGGALSHFLSHIDFAEQLKAKTGLNVSVENDGKCAALAELWKGALQGVNIGMVLTVGTGIGGGLVVNNRLVRGTHFAAGEVSSLPATLKPVNDPFQVWAQINGTPALLKDYQTNKGLDQAINGRQFFEALDANDEVAHASLKRFAQSFALAIFSLQSVLDGEVYAIGGGISAQASFIQAINDALDGFYTQMGGRVPIVRPSIVACQFNNDANLIGALAHHVELFG